MGSFLYPVQKIRNCKIQKQTTTRIASSIELDVYATNYCQNPHQLFLANHVFSSVVQNTVV
mgnify:CR=1 FL=1